MLLREIPEYDDETKKKKDDEREEEEAIVERIAQSEEMEGEEGGEGGGGTDLNIDAGSVQSNPLKGRDDDNTNDVLSV